MSSACRNRITDRLRDVSCRAAQLEFLTVAALGLSAIALVHYGLLGSVCGGLAQRCYFVINPTAPGWYGFLLLHGPILLHLGVHNWMLHLQTARDESRVRYAVGGFLLIGIAAGYASAYNWEGLNGSAAPSATIRNIALAITPILASIFIVWQHRIAGMQARAAGKQADLAGSQSRTAQSASAADRYRAASMMLADEISIVRVSGVHLLERIGHDQPTYQVMILTLLHHFVDETSDSRPTNLDIVEAQRVIRLFENNDVISST